MAPSEDVTMDGKNEVKKPVEDGENKEDFYFTFYSSLQNQANMIGDVSRTGTYRKAILGNAAAAIRDKVVSDVGAGSGISSYMAAQAGAKAVVALEASSMAEKIQILVDQANKGETNPHSRNRVRVVKGMVEDKKVQEDVMKTGKVDTIISEPIGVMSLHERMVETFLLARDLFLKPGGSISPSAGHIFFCPFSDEGSFNETEQKAQFFNQTLFGTDFTALYEPARTEVFAQPVVGIFPPTSSMSAPMAPKTFDFYTCKLDDSLDFEIPIEFIASRTAVMHGSASWFDLDFEPSPPNQPADETEEELVRQWDYPVGQASANWSWMPGESPSNPGPTPEPPRKGSKVTSSTGPNAVRTHWQQARLSLPEPSAVNRNEKVVGSIKFKVNASRSYDSTLDIAVDRPGHAAQPNPSQRVATYNSSQQTFNYSYTGEQTAGVV